MEGLVDVSTCSAEGHYLGEQASLTRGVRMSFVGHVSSLDFIYI